MSVDLSFSIVPKSDQLNADDLIAGPITVTVYSVSQGSSDDQPISVNIGDGRQPYKPCKSMRRLLISAWGKLDTDWLGKKMTLFNDPKVKWAGKEQGGIRISHISGISKPYNLQLTVTRGRRAPYTVKPIVEPDYPVNHFNENIKKWSGLINDGSQTPETIISGLERKGKLSQDMKQQIYNAASQQAPENVDLIEQSDVLETPQATRGFTMPKKQDEAKPEPQQQPEQQPPPTDQDIANNF